MKNLLSFNQGRKNRPPYRPLVKKIEPEVKRYLTLSGTSLTLAQIKTLNDNIKSIKYSTGITLSSVTGYMSLVAPRLFTVSSVDLRPYAMIPGVQFSISDSAHAAVYGGTVTYGTGETLGSALNVSNCQNETYETFDGASATGFHVIASGANKFAGTADEIVLVAGYLIKTTFSQVLTSGIGSSMNYVDSFGGASLSLPSYNAVNAANSYYRTITGSATTILQFKSQSAGEFTISSLASNQVTAADTTGFNATACANAGIDPKSASYTITITKP